MRFRVKALDGGQGVVSYVLDAVDEADARRQLALQDLRIISLARDPAPRVCGGAARSCSWSLFSQELVALLDAGLSLVEAIETLAERKGPGSHGAARPACSRGLYEGQTLGAGAGRTSAELPAAVRRHGARERAHRRAARGADALHRLPAAGRRAEKSLVNACIYPAVLLRGRPAGDRFPDGLRGAALQLHLRGRRQRICRSPRACCMHWGQLIDAHGLSWCVARIGALGGAGLWPDPARGARRMGAWVARIPAVGRQLHLYQLARLYRTVGMLLRGGMPAVTALTHVRRAAARQRCARPLPPPRRRCARAARSRDAMESNRPHHAGRGAHAQGRASAAATWAR